MKLIGSMPYSNKILALKEIQRQQENHNKKLDQVKGQINKNLGKPLQLVAKSKKEYLLEEKFDDIEKGNQFLLKKITNIMSRGMHKQDQSQQLLQQKKVQRSQTSQNLNELNKKSLNQEVRKQELLRIMVENQDMMKKISGAKSTYSITKLAHERKLTEKYIHQISDFPIKGIQAQQPTKTYVQNQFQEQTNRTLEKIKMRSSTPNKLLPLHGSMHSIKILHRCSKKLGFYLYLAEIKIQDGFLLITLEDVENIQNKFILQFTEKEGFHMLKEEFKSDFNLLIDKIRINDRTKNIYFKRSQMKDTLFIKYDEFMQQQQELSAQQQNSLNNSQTQIKKIVLDQNKIIKISSSDQPSLHAIKQKEIPRQAVMPQSEQQVINELDEDQFSAQQNEESCQEEQNELHHQEQTQSKQSVAQGQAKNETNAAEEEQQEKAATKSSKISSQKGVSGKRSNQQLDKENESQHMVPAKSEHEEEKDKDECQQNHREEAKANELHEEQNQPEEDQEQVIGTEPDGNQPEKINRDNEEFEQNEFENQQEEEMQDETNTLGGVNTQQ